MGETVIHVDPSNGAQLAAWDGDEGAYWAEHAERFDRSVAAHHGPFLAAARLSPTDHVLDVGCGTGQTTRDAARAAHAGTALGVDLSAAMLEVARRLAVAEGLTNVELAQADAQVHPFGPGAFDLVISRTAAMFFGDHLAAFRNLRAAMRAGGRLVLLTWQPLDGNEWLRAIATALAAGRPPALPPPGAGPMSLSEPERVRGLLESAGFVDVELDGRRAPMWFGDDVDDASRFILGLTGWMLEGLDRAGREQAVDALRATLADHHGPSGVTLGSATWTIAATAR